MVKTSISTAEIGNGDANSAGRIRIAHFTTHPIQYFAPLYRELARLSEFDLTVFFGSTHGIESSFDEGFGTEVKFDTQLLEGYVHRFLPNRGSGAPSGRFRNFNCPTVGHEFKKGRFDAIWIHGWGYMAQWQAVRAARRLGIPYLIRAETHSGTRSANVVRRIARQLLVCKMLRAAAGCLYLGRANREFYRSMGMAEDRLFPAHYSIDAAFYQRRGHGAEARNVIRARWAAAEQDFVVVTAAKAIPRKRIDNVIRAVARCGDHVRLWIVGEGPERARLERLALELAPDRIVWHGFVNQSGMPAVLGAADAFVLASDDEPWGLVVNEAMACGLPVIASDRVGCVPDLVRERDTGFVFPAGDVECLADRISYLSHDRDAANRMGAMAQKHVTTNYDVRTTAQQIATAVRFVLKK